MATAKSVFERPAVVETSPKLSKKTSKWDKPKLAPPPAVNRESENAEQPDDPELPPPAYTKNMLAKFRSMQQSDGELIKDSTAPSSKPKKVQLLVQSTFDGNCFSVIGSLLFEFVILA